MLKTCGKEGCCPLEQIRGQLGPGDYHDVIASNGPRANKGAVEDPEKYGVPVYPNANGGFDVPDGVMPYHCVEMDITTKDDFRICCKTCGKATPWGVSDIPGMPGAGADWQRKRWNESIGT